MYIFDAKNIYAKKDFSSHEKKKKNLNTKKLPKIKKPIAIRIPVYHDIFTIKIMCNHITVGDVLEGINKIS